MSIRESDMTNNDHPNHIELQYEARQPHADLPFPSPTASHQNATPILIFPEPSRIASSAGLQAGPSGEAYRSGGHESPHPPATITGTPVVINGFIVPDISNPGESLAILRETLIFEHASSIVASPEPTKSTERTPDQAVQATNEPTPTPVSRGRSTNPPTVAIVVPIVVIALLLPFLIFCYLSRRRRKKTQRAHAHRYHPPETVALEKRMQEKLARARKEWSPESLYATKHPTDLASPTRLPLRRMQRPRSAQQFRTSDTPKNSLSGFNFDFSRRATAYSKRGNEPPLPDPGNRRSSISSWEPASPYPSRPTALTPPYLPAGTSTPHAQPSEIQQPEDQFPPGSEASLGLLAGEKAEVGSGGHDISPALSFHEELSPYHASRQPLSDAISEVSGLSVDHDLWPGAPGSARHVKSRSEVSAMEPYPRPKINPI